MGCCENDMMTASRFLSKIDSCFNNNDMKGARECIESWERDAREINNEELLLTILNEAVGFYRRTGKKEKAIKVCNECEDLIRKLNLKDSFSGATIYVNIATTYAFCSREEEAISFYDKAEDVFKSLGKTNTFEYASLLNNKAGTLNTIKKYDEAEKNYLSAIEILKNIGNHDGEIAISFVMLAHITFDKTDNPSAETYEKVENLLDEAIKYIKSKNQPQDGNFAYVLRKCAPSFDYFKRPAVAKALRDKANEIYYN